MKQIEEYFPLELLERQGKTVDGAEQSLLRAVETFIAELEAVEEGRLHVAIRAGGWSPADYGDHLHRVTLAYIDGVERAVRREAPVEHERGWLTPSGGLVSLPLGEPTPGRNRAEIVRDLRSSTAALIAIVRLASEQGAGELVSHVNPYFGPLTPLGCLQMAAVHARHHSRKHMTKGAATS